MTPDVVVDVGHGRRPDGSFDPGTTDGDVTEHAQAHRVVGHTLAALARSAVPFDSDQHGTAGFHDPNYVGSVARVNQLEPRCAVEVHFDWTGNPPGSTPRGGFGIHYPYDDDGPGRQLAARIADAYRSRGLPLRYEGTWPDTRGLAFVRQTDAPAVIWECDRIGPHPDGELREFGEAIAEGVCGWLGHDYIPPEEDGMALSDREETFVRKMVEIFDQKDSNPRAFAYMIDHLRDHPAPDGGLSEAEAVAAVARKLSG